MSVQVCVVAVDTGNARTFPFRNPAQTVQAIYQPIEAQFSVREKDQILLVNGSPLNPQDGIVTLHQQTIYLYPRPFCMEGFIPTSEPHLREPASCVVETIYDLKCAIDNLKDSVSLISERCSQCLQQQQQQRKGLSCAEKYLMSYVSKCKATIQKWNDAKTDYQFLLNNAEKDIGFAKSLVVEDVLRKEKRRTLLDFLAAEDELLKHVEACRSAKVTADSKMDTIQSQLRTIAENATRFPGNPPALSELEVLKRECEVHAATLEALDRNFEDAALQSESQDLSESLNKAKEINRRIGTLWRQCRDCLNYKTKYTGQLSDIIQKMFHAAKWVRVNDAMCEDMLEVVSSDFYVLKRVRAAPEAYRRGIIEVRRRHAVQLELDDVKTKFNAALDAYMASEQHTRWEFMEQYGENIPQGLIPGLDAEAMKVPWLPPRITDKLPPLAPLDGFKNTLLAKISASDSKLRSDFEREQQLCKVYAERISELEETMTKSFRKWEQEKEYIHKEIMQSSVDVANTELLQEKLKASSDENARLREKLDALEKTLQEEMSATVRAVDSHKKVESEMEVQLTELQVLNAKLEKELDDAKHNSIKLNGFTAGDFVLFFPNEHKHYEAFNKDCPHYFLQLEHFQHGLESDIERGMCITGKIVLIEDPKIATEVDNPYNLEVGATFHEVFISSVL